jgi:hypothetical protein
MMTNDLNSTQFKNPKLFKKNSSSSNKKSVFSTIQNLSIITSLKKITHISFGLFVFPHEAVGAAKALLIRQKNSKNLIWVTQIFSTFH